MGISPEWKSKVLSGFFSSFFFFCDAILHGPVWGVGGWGIFFPSIYMIVFKYLDFPEFHLQFLLEVLDVLLFLLPMSLARDIWRSAFPLQLSHALVSPTAFSGLSQAVSQVLLPLLTELQIRQNWNQSPEQNYRQVIMWQIRFTLLLLSQGKQELAAYSCSFW